MIQSEQTPTRPNADLVSRLKGALFSIDTNPIWSPRQPRRRRSIERHTSFRTGLDLKRLCIACPPRPLPPSLFRLRFQSSQIPFSETNPTPFIPFAIPFLFSTPFFFFNRICISCTILFVFFLGPPGVSGCSFTCIRSPKKKQSRKQSSTFHDSFSLPLFMKVYPFFNLLFSSWRKRRERKGERSIKSKVFGVGFESSSRLCLQLSNEE